jgi:hypothetical protein
VNSVQLTATVPASDLTAAATAILTVVTPAPGGGQSNAAFFPVSQVTTPGFTQYGVNSFTPLQQGELQYPTVADINNDGILDVVGGFPNTYSTKIAVLLGRGDGSFQTGQYVDLDDNSVGYPDLNTSVGDFNGDGKIDLAFGDSNANAVAVVLGNGDGTFGAATKLSLPSTYVASLTVVGDFNKDGKLDLIAGNNPALNAPANETAVFSVFLGNGDGTFQNPVNYPIGSFLDSLAAGDVNGDGVLDIVMTSSTGLQVFLGKGDGTFASPVVTGGVAGSQSGMVIADVNGDSKLDLLLADGGGNLIVVLGNGDGTFRAPVSYSTSGTNSFSFSVGDFNGDGKLDAALGGDSSVVSILYGNGDGTFQPAVTYPAPISMGSVAADFNGDGKLDLFIGAETSGLLGTVLLQGSFPVLGAVPGSLTFGQQPLNTTSAAQSVMLTNSGATVLTVTKIGLTGTNAGDYAETTNCGATLAASASCQVSITFTPTAQGTRSATLAVSDNAPGSPQSLTITGTTTPAPELTLSPASLMFPGQYVGTSGLPQTITATNTGGATLTIASVKTSASDFGVLNACGGSLAAGSSCSIGVFFDPSASGSRSGTLTIADDAGDSPQSVALAGTGQDFSFSASSSTDTIAPGQTATYTIAVNPIAGFNQPVALSCSGAPTGSTCSLSSTSVALSGSSPVSVTVSVTTVGSSMHRSPGVENSRLGGGMLVYLSVSRFPGLLLLAGLRYRSGRWKIGVFSGLVFLAVVSLGTIGCGGSGGGNTGGGGGGTPANTYTLTVTGNFASGTANLTHTTSLTMVVQ